MTTKQKLLSYNNQKAKYFLRQDCSACFYATPPKGLSVKNQTIKTENCSECTATPKAGLSCKKTLDYS